MSIDLIGQKFNRLVVVEKGQRSGEQSFKWLCLCECGNKKYVRGDHLKSGLIKSCGCMQIEAFKRTIEGNIIHGLTGHSLYHVWCSMKQRCYDKNYISYKDYGGRGIKVCKEWKSDFMAFYGWAVSNGWEQGLTLDRFPNNNGNYCPENCRWATPERQANNRRSNIIVELDGVKMSLTDACKKLKLNSKLIRQRIKRDNYSFKEAIIK